MEEVGGSREYQCSKSQLLDFDLVLLRVPAAAVSPGHVSNVKIDIGPNPSSHGTERYRLGTDSHSHLEHSIKSLQISNRQICLISYLVARLYP